MQQLTLDILPAPNPNLDNFIAGPNAEALAVARQLGTGAVPARSVLFWGPPGSGKSHLLESIAAARTPTHQWLDPSRADTFELPTGPGVILAEDLTSWADEPLHQLFHLLNLARPREDLCLVATAEQPPAGWGLRDDLRTRMAAGLVLGIALLSDADKLLALQQHAAAQGHKDIQAVSQWLLIHRDRDIRALLSYLDGLDRFALQARRPVSLRLLHEFERNQLPDKGA